jgi:hypothetical protein
MPTISTVSLRPARLFGLITPLAIAIGVGLLLMLPNLTMHTNPDDQRRASQSADAAAESSPIMR